MKNLQTIKDDFPIFRHHPHLVYLDSAATTLKPRSIIEAIVKYYEAYSANVGRGLYPLAEKTTEMFEASRATVASFLRGDLEEIIFTRNATEGINLLATTLSTFLEKNDNIVVTEMEHHSNFLPWKRIASEREVEFRTIPIGKDGNINTASLATIIDTHTVIVSFSAISNVLGTKVPVTSIVKTIKSISPDAIIIIDASQVAGHSKIDVKEWGADFIVFSGHKMFGPTGVGVLWGQKKLLNKLPPYQLGGGMVSDACAREPIWKDAPYRFEAGTPDIASIIGLKAAVAFIEEIGIENIEAHETELARYAMEKLAETFGEGITIFGSKDATTHAALLSFTLQGIHPHDLAHILGEKNICIRAGEHCASPIHQKLGLSATARISFSIYNNKHDIDALVEEMEKARKLISNF